MTPLMLACRLGRESMVGMLVDVFGAELDYADKVKFPKEKERKTRASIYFPRQRDVITVPTCRYSGGVGERT